MPRKGVSKYTVEGELYVGKYITRPPALKGRKKASTRSKGQVKGKKLDEVSLDDAIIVRGRIPAILWEELNEGEWSFILFIEPDSYF